MHASTRFPKYLQLLVQQLSLGQWALLLPKLVALLELSPRAAPTRFEVPSTAKCLAYQRMILADLYCFERIEGQLYHFLVNPLALFWS